ncbi:MAG: DMT family transporter [Archaeoglobus sp.]|nr:DMT family transporter [Archaeoglobus sp.]
MAISLASILAVLASAPGSVTAFWRLFLSLFILLILRPKIIQKPQKLRFLGFPIVAGVSLGIHFASWIESLFHASVAVSTTVVCTHALFSGFFSSFFGEKPNKIQLFGAAIAIGGVYFLSGADPSSTPYGVVLALIGAVAGGVYFATGRFVGDRIAFNSYVFLTYSVATLTTLLINIINLSINSPANPVNPPINLSLSYDLFHYLFHYLFDYPMQTWIYFVLLAIIPMSIGHTILNYVLRHMKALPVTTTVLGEAVGASILAYLILGQLLPANAYLAMIVVLTGIAIVLKRD